MGFGFARSDEWHRACLPHVLEKRLPHEKLLAYQAAIELLSQVTELRLADPRLRDQATRASKSVCLNIAEAVGRFSGADRRRVYAIARGECCEAAAAIDIAVATAECDISRGRAARAAAGRVYALLTGLIRRCDLDTAGPKTSHLHNHASNSARETEHQPAHVSAHEKKHRHGHDSPHQNEHQHQHDSPHQNEHQHQHESD